jgi:hypothetical protein
VVGNVNGPTALQIELYENAWADVGMWQNAVSDLDGDGLAISLDDTAGMDAVIRDNQFTGIGDEAGDDALTVASVSGSSAQVRVRLHNNGFQAVAGRGLHLSADGSSSFVASITENSFTNVNTHNAGSAFLAEQATAEGDADLRLRLAGNHVALSTGTAYALRYRGGGAFELEGSAGDAASQIALDNTGQPIVVSGSVGMVTPGSLDANLPQQIEGRVWLDENDSGVQDVGESGMAGVTLTAAGTEAVSGDAIAWTTQTDADGFYAFVGLLDGAYVLTLQIPAGHPLADADQGSDETRDSDFVAAQQDAAEATASLGSGGPDLTLDAGLLRSWQNPGVPKNLYELDVNGDGFVTAVDALILINDLNAHGARRLSDFPGTAPAVPPYLDVDGNGDATALDVLLVINYLNTSAGGAGEYGGEGEPDGSAGEPDLRTAGTYHVSDWFEARRCTAQESHATGNSFDAAAEWRVEMLPRHPFLDFAFLRGRGG